MSIYPSQGTWDTYDLVSRMLGYSRALKTHVRSLTCLLMSQTAYPSLQASLLAKLRPLRHEIWYYVRWLLHVHPNSGFAILSYLEQGNLKVNLNLNFCKRITICKGSPLTLVLCGCSRSTLFPNMQSLWVFLIRVGVSSHSMANCIYRRETVLCQKHWFLLLLYLQYLVIHNVWCCACVCRSEADVQILLLSFPAYCQI